MIDSFSAWFAKYKEGAIVALALIDMVGRPQRWIWDMCGGIGDDSYYPGFNVLYLPVIDKHGPLELLLFLQQMEDFLSQTNVETECAKYYRSPGGEKPFDRKQSSYDVNGTFIYTDVGNLFKGTQYFAGRLLESLEKRETLREGKEVIGLAVWKSI